VFRAGFSVFHPFALITHVILIAAAQDDKLFNFDFPCRMVSDGWRGPQDDKPLTSDKQPPLRAGNLLHPGSRLTPGTGNRAERLY
jgi:hypothetical protein